jgi:dCTP deaminase
MELSKKARAITTLAREVVSRTLRAAAYARQLSPKGIVVEDGRVNNFAGQVVDDIDKRLAQILADTLQCVCEVEATSDDSSVEKAKANLLIQLEHISRVQRRGFARLKHLVPTVELTRFARVIARQILHIFPEDVPSARSQPSELTLGVTIVPVDEPTEVLLVPALHGREDAALAQIRDPVTYPSFADYLLDSHQYVRGCAVGIPRMDSMNPLRWPSAVHEIAHACCGSQLIARTIILRDAKRTLSAQELNVFDEAISSLHVDQWLLECWCDLFGAVAFGPAFWRAQSIAFLSERFVGQPTPSAHPPRLFRLLLIWETICHRFPTYIRKDLEPLYADIKEMYELLDGVGGSVSFDQPIVRELYFLFQRYFLNHFLVLKSEGEDTLTQLQSGYQRLMKYWEASTPDTLNSITQELQQGIPVPTVPPSQSGAHAEKPILVQELLIATWSSFAALENEWFLELRRCAFNNPTAFDHGMRKLCYFLAKSSASATDEAQASSLLPLEDRYDGLDSATLRSLQISEWVHHLESTSSENASALCSRYEQAAEVETFGNGLLVDFEIYALFKKRKLRIIPLIDLTTQLGSSSIDVRIGPTFEILQPSCVGDHGDKSYSAFQSQIKDLDLGQYFVIMPGQFVLASTMEYLIFPDNISAELEGRSSFARLGLEVHRTAGFIDNGFAGCVTFELFNSGAEPITLTPGDRIAQLRLFRTSKPVRPYAKKSSAKYGKRLTHIGSLRKQDVEGQFIGKFRRGES